MDIEIGQASGNARIGRIMHELALRTLQLEHVALDQAAKRFEGASAVLKAAAVNRLRGQWLGGARGGNLIAQADAVFQRQGVGNPALLLPRLLPALAQRRL